METYPNALYRYCLVHLGGDVSLPVRELEREVGCLHINARDTPTV